ncbi:MAG: glycosyltransferase [Winogradskyella sp.]|uniref:glycosyltransferase n=1 Tax=Winogradskyella sp. TaxID=1883156 RepID=UPI0025E3C996|nr:glycosyltransferase [Winogradskyella sp.]
MIPLEFSFIIPVYNRPQEIKELLDSFCELEGNFQFEIVIVEDGSELSSENVIISYKSKLNVAYYYKDNSGPGDSRNFGMRVAKGNYFIILDSDVILPSNYLININSFLSKTYYDCFGGPDAAHPSFSSLQKAISFSMTSFITTGGIRGGDNQVEDFQPRSFNMGISKKAFLDSGGFGKIHPGEDPDLSLRLHKLGYKTTLINKAYVFHKRRISWSKFFNQVNKFGKVRPILNQWHPESKSMVYWFPTCFLVGLMFSMVLLVVNIPWLLYGYILYFVIAFCLAFISSKNIVVAVKSVLAIVVQFAGYGLGFLKSYFKLVILGKKPKEAFPKLFF